MNIHLDQKEFTFQLESHPDFPSLLAVSDTLHLFQIDNAALHVDSSEITSLPNNFITKLKDTKEDSLIYVETYNSNHSYTVYQNTKKITFSKEAFLKKWNGIVFLVEENTKLQKTLHHFKFTYILAIVCFLSFLLLLKHYFSTLESLLFLIFPFTGLLFSVIALKDVFNLKHTIIDAFCYSSNSQQCTSVVNSAHWKFLEKINFSDLSITFFSFQIVLFFILGFTDNITTFFYLQKIILFASLPVLTLSIYYQKFIIKKWCSVCISISVIIMVEIVFVLAFYPTYSIETSISDYYLTAFIALSILLSWKFIKSTLSTINYLKTAELKATRFKKNYPLFKNTLISNPITVLPQTALIFGNREAKFTLDFITNPYCGFCKAPYFMLKDVLQRHERDIRIRFFFNFDLKKNPSEASQLVQHLIYIHQQFGNLAFFTALENWYKYSDLKSWLQQYSYTYNSSEIDQTIHNHRANFIKQKLTFTPFLGINGYRFPEMYSIMELNYFIEELLHDNTIQLA
ncbi:vitamin K epoxide reductase family protein [uncultured Kordia sp.]|uniref:vitamin K epoxide reductase family protein n=1 Tax=uncultured Kordia sp. TaxID=507699 RepID=UPI002607F959|nr:vitamin K epoxide reductase family protein [uncultured Kordia sp.]